MARGVDEGDLTAVNVHDGCADVLSDAASLARSNAGMANGVEGGRLAVVDMTHNSDHRRTRLKVIFGIVVDDGILFLGRHHANLAAHVVGNKLDELVGHGLGDSKNLAQHEQTLDDVVGRHAQKLCELADRRALHDLDDAVVEHQIGVDALFDGLHGQTFALCGLALFLALLTTALALVARSGGDGSARLGENLVALEFLSLHGHLGVAVFARCVRKLGNLGLEMMPATLAALAFAALLLRSARRSSCLLVRLLCADTRLFRLDLGKQRIERRRRLRSGSGPFRSRSGLGCGFLRAASKIFRYGLALCHLGSKLGSAGVSSLLRTTSLFRRLLFLYLARKAGKARRHGGGSGLFLLGRFAGLLGRGRRTGTAGTLRIAQGALALDRLAALAFFVRLFLGGRFLFGLRYLGDLGIDVFRLLAKLGGNCFFDRFDVVFRQDAGVALRGDFQILNAREQLLAVHAEFLRQFMNSHAGHTVLLVYPLLSRTTRYRHARRRSGCQGEHDWGSERRPRKRRRRIRALLPYHPRR